MFRVSKLYLIAVVLLATFLVTIIQLVPRTFEKSIEEHLEAEALTNHTLFVQSQQLRQWQRIRWAEFVASDRQLEQLTAQVDTAPDQAAPEETEVLLRSLAEAVGQAAARASLEIGLTLDFTAVITSGRLVVSSPEPTAVLAELAALPEVDAVFRRGATSSGLHILADRAYYTACVPIKDDDGILLGVLLAAERLGVANLARIQSDRNTHEVDILVFGDDGAVVTSTLRNDPVGEEIQRLVEDYVQWIVNHDALPVDSMRSGESRLVRTDADLVLLLPGRMPNPSRGADRRAIGFMLVLTADKGPPSLAALVIDNREILQNTKEVALIVGLGLALLIIGILIFELEGRRYRRTVLHLRKQIARIASPQPESESIAVQEPEEEPPGRPRSSTPQSLPISTEPVEVEAPQSVFSSQPSTANRIEDQGPTTIEAVPSKIMTEPHETERALVEEPASARFEEIESPVTIKAVPPDIFQTPTPGETAVQEQLSKVSDLSDEIESAPLEQSEEEPPSQPAAETGPSEPSLPEQVSDWSPPSLESLFSKARHERAIPRPPKTQRSQASPAGTSLIPPPPSESALESTETGPPQTGESVESQPSLDEPETKMPSDRGVEGPVDQTEPAPASTLSPPMEEEQTDYEELFRQYLQTRQECGQSVEGINLEAFRKKLERNEALVRKNYQCTSVRFQIGVKDGKTVVKARPVR